VAFRFRRNATEGVPYSRYETTRKGRTGRWQQEAPGQTGAGLDGRPDRADDDRAVVCRAGDRLSAGEAALDERRQTHLPGWLPLGCQRHRSVPAGLMPARGRGASARCRHSGRRERRCPARGRLSQRATALTESPSRDVYVRTSVFSYSRRAKLGQRAGRGGQQPRSTVGRQGELGSLGHRCPCAIRHSTAAGGPQKVQKRKFRATRCQRNPSSAAPR
jgi:hypothetical protein